MVTIIYDLIELIKSRPAMYIGNRKLSTLKSFLDGYQFSIWTHEVKTKKEFPPFWYFHEWARYKYRWRESTSGWANIILTENDHDEELALKVFFELIDEFKTLHPIRLEKAKVTAKHLSFHHSDQCRVKYTNGKPIYDHADAVFIIKFSHGFGYAYAVTEQTPDQNLDVMRWGWGPVKSKKLVREELARLFGPIDSWEVMKGEFSKLLEQIL